MCRFNRFQATLLGSLTVSCGLLFLLPALEPPFFVWRCRQDDSSSTNKQATIESSDLVDGSSSSSNIILDLPVNVLTRIGLRLNSEPDATLGWLLEPYKEIFDAAFRDQRVVFIGDSTLRFLVKWLQVLLFHSDGNSNDASCSTENDLWSNWTLTQANNRMQELATKCMEHTVNLKALNSPEFTSASTTSNSSHTSKRTLVEWFGFGGRPNGEGMEKYLKLAWINSARRHPDVLVVNMGLHWLHRMGMGRNTHAHHVYRWIHYEDLWLQDAVDRARAMQTVRLLLFKTTNRKCKFDVKPGVQTDPYDLLRAPATTLQQTLQMCESMVADQFDEVAYDENNDTTVFADVSAEQIASFCRHGTFSPYGTSYLNERLYRFVEKQKLSLDKDEQNTISNSTMKIGIYNDHDIETCEYTTDTRHYLDLNVPRLWVLANLIVPP